MNIAWNSNMHVQKRLEPCWGHQQIEKEKCHIFETFRKSSPEYVESIRAHKRPQKCFLQHRQTPRISIFWLFSLLFPIKTLKTSSPKMVSYFQENEFFQKNQNFSWITHWNDHFALHDLGHTARKTTRSENFVTQVHKNLWKWWNFRKFHSWMQKNFQKKKCNFFKSGRKQLPCILWCYKTHAADYNDLLRPLYHWI